MHLPVRFCLSLALLVLAQACTVEVRESDFVRSDDEIHLLGADELAEIRDMREGLEVERLRLSRPDGALARGLWLRQPGAERVLIYFGGNTMRIAQSYPVLDHLLALGTDIVWLDHRGLGASTGDPDLDNLQGDGLGTFDHVAGITDKPVVLHGMSLGSFIAGYVALNRPVAGLILEASATNADEWMRTVTPWYARPFIRVEVDPVLADAGNDRTVQQYRGSLFILVGEEDGTTPVRLSRALFEQAVSEDKHLHVAPDRGHGSAVTGPRAKTELREFIESL